MASWLVSSSDSKWTERLIGRTSKKIFGIELSSLETRFERIRRCLASMVNLVVEGRMQGKKTENGSDFDLEGDGRSENRSDVGASAPSGKLLGDDPRSGGSDSPSTPASVLAAPKRPKGVARSIGFLRDWVHVRVRTAGGALLAETWVIAAGRSESAGCCPMSFSALETLLARVPKTRPLVNQEMDC
jgi:hypothetical protein